MPGDSGAASLSAPAGGAACSLSLEHALDGIARQAARPQQHRLAEAGDDGGFDADRRRAAVDNEIDAAAQIGKHVGSRGRRNVAGAIGRRRDDGLAEGVEDGVRDRVIRNAHRKRIEAGGGKLGDRTCRRL